MEVSWRGESAKARWECGSCDKSETREDKERLSSLDAKWESFLRVFVLFEHVSICIGIEKPKNKTSRKLTKEIQFEIEGRQATYDS